MFERPHLVGDPGKGFQTIEGDLTCGQCVPQVRTFHGSPHGPYQGFRSIGMEVQPGGRPFRQGTATIGRGHLTPVQILENIQLSCAEAGDLRLGCNEDPFLLIQGHQLGS